MKHLILVFSILLVLCFTVGVKAETINLGTANTVTIRGEINGSSMAQAMLDLAKLDEARGAKEYTIYIALDSPGGSILDGNDFIDFAKTVKNVKTITLFAASMASHIAQALPGERLITERGEQMFHRAAGGFQGQFEEGEVETRLLAAKKLVRYMEAINAARMGISLKEYKAKVVNELWLTGLDAIEANVVDRSVDIKCSHALIKQKSEVIVESFFGSFSVTYSSCPLMKQPLPEKKKESL